MERGRIIRTLALTGAVAAIAAITITATPAMADIEYRSFSASAAIGPPADEFAQKTLEVTSAAFGTAGQVRFVRLPGIPAIPSAFGGDIVRAVAAGKAGGGFDAAYISGGDLNKAWGFLWNSAVPFGPTFDEFMGFLFGSSIDRGTRTGLELVQETLDLRGREIVALPIVGSPEQLSGYFPEPMGDVPGHRGIGLIGLCQKGWTLRYLPPGENVLGLACDALLAEGKIKKKALSFIAAVPGGGSLVDAAIAGTLQGFEFATPLDDVSQLFNTANNPGTVGLRFVHTPGWQQQFLVTWLIVNKTVWRSLTPGQQAVVSTVAHDHVLASYAENLRQQGAALDVILGANKADGNPNNDLVMSRWSAMDQARLRAATIKFLNARITDAALPADDRSDYARMLEALRIYVRSNDHYWDVRRVEDARRFEDWASASGDCWEAKCEPTRCGPPR